MEEPIAFLDGRWVPASAAAVPLDDAGFVLGAAVTEQLRTFAGKLFRLDGHLARLARSLEIVGLDPGMTLAQLADTAEELAAHNHRLMDPGDDLRLSIVVTPGSHPAYGPPLRVCHCFGEAVPNRQDSTSTASAKQWHTVRPAPRPVVYLHTHPLAFHLWAAKYRTGQALVTTGVRQVPEHCWPAELKCRSRMHYYLADRAAAATDPEARALLLDTQGLVTEASTANLLIYRGGEGIVSPPWNKVLHGISASVVAELARRLDIPYGYRDLRPDEVAAADEAMLTSTSTCILPVTRFNGQPVGTGLPGKVFSALLAAWSEMVGLDIAAQAARYASRESENPKSEVRNPKLE